MKESGVYRCQEDRDRIDKSEVAKDEQQNGPPPGKSSDTNTPVRHFDARLQLSSNTKQNSTE